MTIYKTFEAEVLDARGNSRFLAGEAEIETERIIWGSDADGRRGEEREEIKEIHIISLYDDLDGEDVTEAYRNDSSVIQAARRAL